jgi:hypothetical protein
MKPVVAVSHAFERPSGQAAGASSDRPHGRVGVEPLCDLRHRMCTSTRSAPSPTTWRDAPTVRSSPFSRAGPWPTTSTVSCCTRVAGVRLNTLPVVGLGSVCRRQRTEELARIVRFLHDAGISTHGFGVKKQGHRRYGRLLVSVDSMARSYGARRRPPLPRLRAPPLQQLRAVRPGQARGAAAPTRQRGEEQMVCSRYLMVTDSMLPLRAVRRAHRAQWPRPETRHNPKRHYGGRWLSGC